ncbi:hypothetical protein AWH63_10920 [Marinobacter sp. C18]|uniref:hypothetical protein n=1 Tax=Marinobacter sp. C18 TaxID=1772288 RepID=UPI000948DF4B|nr:hypothetical protein [Marinobacter sp. C18]OLF82043.1 hypothetical protein AWH63_10920 [Marinobacter sp. C18]
MNPSILHAMQVLTADDPRGESSQPVIVVLTRISEPSQHSSKARWTLAFIGPLQEFHQSFIHRMARDFDKGAYLDRFHRSIRGGDFTRTLNRSIERAQSLTANTLRRHGVGAVTWSEEEATATGIKDLPMVVQVPFFMDNRYGFEIKTDEDAQRLLLCTLNLKRLAKQSGKCDPLYTGRPMLEQPARLKAASAH